MSTHTPSRQPKGLPVGGQFATSARNEAEAVTLASDEAQAGDYMAFMDPGAPPEPDTFTCAECGEYLIADPDGSEGVLVHIDEDGNRDYDADEDHVGIDEDQVEDLGISNGANEAFPNGRCGACGFGLDTAGLCYQHDCSNFDSDSDLADLGSLTSGDNLDETTRCWSCHEDGYTTQADTSDDNGPLCEGCAERRAEDEAETTDLDETDDEMVSEFYLRGSSALFSVTVAEDEDEDEAYSLYKDGTFIGSFDYDGAPDDHAAIKQAAQALLTDKAEEATQRSLGEMIASSEPTEFTMTPTLAYRANARWSRALLAEYAESATTDADAADLRATLAVSALATLTTLRGDQAQAGMNDEEKAVIERLDIALKVADQADLSVEWDSAFAALKSAGVAHDADDPIAVRYRNASDAVNHANRRLDFYIATGQARSTDPVDAAGRLAEALQNALAVGDNHFAL